MKKLAKRISRKNGDDFTSHSLYMLFGLSRVGSSDLYLENHGFVGDLEGN